MLDGDLIDLIYEAAVIPQGWLRVLEILTKKRRRSFREFIGRKERRSQLGGYFSSE